MSSHPNTSALLGLASGGAWGVGDFIGGWASRRANVFSIVALGYCTGTVLMLAAATFTHEAIPPSHDLIWAAMAGVVGGGALSAFYAGLAAGKMGIVAPISAVLTAAIPVVFAALSEGVPKHARLLGFALALIGIWMVSRPDEGHSSAAGSSGLFLAVLSGIGFGVYLILIRCASLHAAFWPLALTRGVSSLAVALGAASVGKLRSLPLGTAGWSVLAGCMDVSGIAFFVFAAQLGRLDVPAVLSSLYPAVTVVMARMLLHEHMGRGQRLGMLLLLAAILLIVF